MIRDYKCPDQTLTPWFYVQDENFYKTHVEEYDDCTNHYEESIGELFSYFLYHLFDFIVMLQVVEVCIFELDKLSLN
jgi:hypothetical protein